MDTDDTNEQAPILPRERATKLSKEWSGNPNIGAVTTVIEHVIDDVIALIQAKADWSTADLTAAIRQQFGARKYQGQPRGEALPPIESEKP